MNKDLLALGQGETLQLMRSFITSDDIASRTTVKDGESNTVFSLKPSAVKDIVAQFKEALRGRPLIVGKILYNDGHTDLDRLIETHEFARLAKLAVGIIANPIALNHVGEKLK